MKRSHRLRWQAAAVVTVAAFTVAACSSGSGSSSSTGSGSGSSNSALTASAPGITPTQILIGSHQPLTGPAAPGYSEIAPASAAYFAYVNAHGGVNGRKIVYKYLDDAYNPTTTASVVRQLVLQDSVYAVFDGLGTPTHLAAVSFLNAQKVPDVFVQDGVKGLLDEIPASMVVSKQTYDPTNVNIAPAVAALHAAGAQVVVS